MATEVRMFKLREMEPGQTGDCFAVLSEKVRATTRDGKPYYRVTFRDAGRSANSMIWADTPWFSDCDTRWQAGGFYKLRCTFFENQYGPQLDLDRIREVQDGDAAQGFDPAELQDSSRFNADDMFAELMEIAETQISVVSLRQLVVGLLTDFGEPLKTLAAAVRNHHAFAGGYLEHVLSVTKTCVFLADKYLAYYPHTQPPLSKSLVIAGAILHDIGKVVELQTQALGTDYTARGRLIGHILLGRDLIREKAAAIEGIDQETLLRLEHLIVAHQDLPEWGSPIPPHTLEALIVHYADDLVAKYHMMARALETDSADNGEFTSKDNPLRRRIFRGLR